MILVDFSELEPKAKEQSSCPVLHVSKRGSQVHSTGTQKGLTLLQTHTGITLCLLKFASCKLTWIEDAGLVSIFHPLEALLEAPPSKLDEVCNDNFAAPTHKCRPFKASARKSLHRCIM